MLRASSRAVRRLAPEVEDVIHRFFEALPAVAESLFASVILYGPQARRYEPEETFCLLVVLSENSVRTKAALALAADAASLRGKLDVQVTSATLDELVQPSIARLVSSAKREGLMLWEREAAVPA